MVLTVDLLLFTLLSLTRRCYSVQLQLSILSRVLTLLPILGLPFKFHIGLGSFLG